MHQIKVHLADIDHLHLRVLSLQNTRHKHQPALFRPSIVRLQGSAPRLLVVSDPHKKIVSITDLLLQVMIGRSLEEGRHREIDIILVEIIAAIDILAHVLAPDPQREEDVIVLHHLVAIIEAVESTDTQKVEAQVDNEKEVVDADIALHRGIVILSGSKALPVILN